MKKSSLLLLLLSIVIWDALAQDTLSVTPPKNKVFFEITPGVSFLTKHTIEPEFNNSWVLGARFWIELPGRKFSLAPIFNVRQYKLEESSYASQEYLSTNVKTGLQFNYKIAESKDYKFQLHSIAELNYNWSQFNFRYDQGGYAPEGMSTLELVKLLSGEGLGLTLGGRIKYGYFFMELDYNMFASNFEVQPDFEELLEEENLVYVSSKEKIRAMEFVIGVSIPLSSQGNTHKSSNYFYRSVTF